MVRIENNELVSILTFISYCWAPYKKTFQIGSDRNIINDNEENAKFFFLITHLKHYNDNL